MQTPNSSLKPGMRLADVLGHDPGFLLLLEHFEILLPVGEKSIEQACRERSLRTGFFIAVAGLFRGKDPDPGDFFPSDIPGILPFLQNCHRYYRQEKYPEILSLIRQVRELNHQPGVGLLEPFFEEYFREVQEHLNFEEKVVFPYIMNLSGKTPEGSPFTPSFKVSDYQEHHDDIQEKLNDLKNLLLKHLPVEGDQMVRRKLMLSLSELEHDLFHHTRIEDNILIPLVRQLEENRSNPT